MGYESNDNMVSHPNHYQGSNGMEVIDVISEFTSDLQGIECVDTANAIKYILRWKKKNGVQDIEKAIWYLSHLRDYLSDIKPLKTVYDEQDCYTCKFRNTSSTDYPCVECNVFSENGLVNTKQFYDPIK